MVAITITYPQTQTVIFLLPLSKSTQLRYEYKTIKLIKLLQITIPIFTGRILRDSHCVAGLLTRSVRHNFEQNQASVGVSH